MFEGLSSLGPPDMGVMAALLIFIAASVWLGTAAQRVVRKGSFLKGYFLGNRGLGAWALALTATVQSGGTFLGFPSLVYTYGWIVTLWIASYMVVPIAGFGLLAKRFSQLSRRTGAITVPDLFRERFGSPAVGLVSSLLILFFMSFMMVAQFKGGATVMKVAWQGVGEEDLPYMLSNESIRILREQGVDQAVLDKVSPLIGVGFPSGASLRRKLDSVLPGEVVLPNDAGAGRANSRRPVTPAPSDLRPDVIGSTSSLQDKALIVEAARKTDWLFYLGLVIFTLTVVGYTMIGGFLAAVWTDLFQSVMMFIGVAMLLGLAIWNFGSLEQATRTAVDNTGPGFVFGPGYGADGRQFLTGGLAISFFFVWVFGGVGSPASMVRVMACKNTETIRRSIVMLAVYNLMIYLPLIMVCIYARVAMPDLAVSDEVIPRMALLTTRGLWGGSYIAGLILAAPFGAVMATVSSYLVVIASGLVRDVYQRFLRPQATDREIKRLTYAVMMGVGLIALLANIRPVDYLQAIVVFCAASGAATFLVPAIMVAFWRRATAAGIMAAMLVGAGSMVTLYIIGAMVPDPLVGPATSFRPYFLLNLEPVVWGMAASLIAGVLVSLASRPPNESLLARLFDEPAGPMAYPSVAP